MKLTAVGCDNCGRTLKCRNWSRLWRDAQRGGWVRGASNDEHFCCEVCREAFENSRQATNCAATSAEPQS